MRKAVYHVDRAKIVPAGESFSVMVRVGKTWNWEVKVVVGYPVVVDVADIADIGTISHLS